MTHQWRKLRRIKLDNDPWCQWHTPVPGVGRSPECRYPAAQVDHIEPVAEKPERELDYDNLQSLCGDHHRKKSNADRARRNGKVIDDDDNDEFDVTLPPGM